LRFDEVADGDRADDYVNWSGARLMVRFQR